jgi:hypothetical protein
MFAFRCGFNNVILSMAFFLMTDLPITPGCPDPSWCRSSSGRGAGWFASSSSWPGKQKIDLLSFFEGEVKRTVEKPIIRIFDQIY